MLVYGGAFSLCTSWTTQHPRHFTEEGVALKFMQVREGNSNTTNSETSLFLANLNCMYIKFESGDAFQKSSGSCTFTTALLQLLRHMRGRNTVVLKVRHFSIFVCCKVCFFFVLKKNGIQNIIWSIQTHERHI